MVASSMCLLLIPSLELPLLLLPVFLYFSALITFLVCDSKCVGLQKG